jgi:hypothetical protein
MAIIPDTSLLSVPGTGRVTSQHGSHDGSTRNTVENVRRASSPGGSAGHAHTGLGQDDTIATFQGEDGQAGPEGDSYLGLSKEGKM